MDQSALISQVVPFLAKRGYEPGERIPSERDLGIRFGVSRGQIREALACLEALRIVERRAKSGLYMADEEPSIEALALFARVGVALNPKDVQQIVELRRIHEIEAVKLACARRTEANIQRMREILNSSEQHIDDAEAVAQHDQMFHSELVRATQNNVFLRIVKIFYLMTAEPRIFYFRDMGTRRKSCAEHRKILAAVAASDVPLAVELIEAHLQGVDSYWRDLSERQSAGEDISVPSL